MKIVLQRVNSASVKVEGRFVAQISGGLLLLLGFAPTDDESKFPAIINKLVNLRVFAEGDKKFDRSALDLKAEILLVSQFTLFADTSKGRRPEFFGAMAPQQAQELYQKFIAEFLKTGLKVESGVFGAYMQVALENDGPVTLNLEF